MALQNKRYMKLKLQMKNKVLDDHRKSFEFAKTRLKEATMTISSGFSGDNTYTQAKET